MGQLCFNIRRFRLKTDQQYTLVSIGHLGYHKSTSLCIAGHMFPKSLIDIQ